MNPLRFLVVFVVVLALIGSLPGAPVPKDAPPTPGQEITVALTADVSMRFCWLPAGECPLGTTEEEMKTVSTRVPRSAWLQAEVNRSKGKGRTDGFWLGKFEVTQGQWEGVLGKDRNRSFFGPRGIGAKRTADVDRSLLPVEKVAWEDTQEFLAVVNKTVKFHAQVKPGTVLRLPTENEWEYACRGGTKDRRHFYFGQSITGDLANFDSKTPFGTDKAQPSLNRTAVVGSYEKAAPHPWGLCDMAGNVGEWCQDEDPEVADSHFVRGGSWSSVGLCCRSAYRRSVHNEIIDDTCGFRVLIGK